MRSQSNNHFFFFPFFFFFLTTKNGLESKVLGYYIFSNFSPYSISSGCISPFLMASMEVNIFCFANFNFMSSIQSKNYYLLLMRLFYSMSYEKGLGEVEVAATVFILRRSKHESPPSVLRLYLFIYLIQVLPSRMASLILVLYMASSTFRGSLMADISLKALMDCIFRLTYVLNLDLCAAQSSMYPLKLSSYLCICSLQLFLSLQRLLIGGHSKDSFFYFSDCCFNKNTFTNGSNFPLFLSSSSSGGAYYGSQGSPPIWFISNYICYCYGVKAGTCSATTPSAGFTSPQAPPTGTITFCCCYCFYGSFASSSCGRQYCSKFGFLNSTLKSLFLLWTSSSLSFVFSERSFMQATL